LPWLSTKSSRTRYGLLVLDLDWFKEVNDVHGQQSLADQVLMEFTRNSLEELQKSDRPIFRMGGEEFVLLLRWF